MSLTGHGLGTALGLELHGVGRITPHRQILFAGWIARRWFVLAVFTTRPTGGKRFAHVFGVQAATDLVPAEERTLATLRRRS